MVRQSLPLVVLSSVALLVGISYPPSVRAADETAEAVQRILKSSCHSCHGPESQEGGLRLDIGARALQGGDRGPMIVAGSSDKSRLISILAGQDEEVGRMPPEGEGTPLTAEQVQLFTKWINDGARWTAKDASLAGEHWSFQPVQLPTLPFVADGLANPIDSFIFGRLAEAGFEPSPEAAPEVLLRRLYLDLLGILPAPAETRAYLSDDRAAAYERLVDRLLASPHFGERWGRRWLDLARYADSDGYEKDRARPHAWRYRNWVINALNADLPFDQFSLHQLAGDMLPDASIEQRVASGFHRNTLHNTEGGTDQEEDRVKKTVDRVNTMGTIWLGLTVGCAQCHSHKYDPLTQREYYSLYGFFNNINEQNIEAPLEIDQDRYAAVRRTHREAQNKLEREVRSYEETKLEAAQQAWEPTALDTQTVWTTLESTEISSKHGASFKARNDKATLVTDANQVSDVYQVTSTVSGPVTALRLEALPDESLPKKGPGRAENGNFVLAAFRAFYRPVGAPDEEEKQVEFERSEADFSQNEWPVEAAIRTDIENGWAVSPQIGRRHVAMFIPKQPLGESTEYQLRIELDQTYTRGNTHNLGCFRLSYTRSAPHIQLDGISAELATILKTERSRRTDDQRKQLRAYFRTIDPGLAKVKQALAAHQKQAPQPSAVQAQSVVEIDKPRPIHVHIRGDFLNKGEEVQVATPAFLPAAEKQDSLSRVDLARWLAAEENPLTSRVVVNRIWQRLFGRGIVATVDDFGTQGDPPTHPELLDWLAVELRTNDWSVKQLIRTIVLSQSYRQSARVRKDLFELDPDNELIGRQARQRLEAEVIRDVALKASGLLDPRVGGPSVRPRQPSEYASLTYANSAKWKTSSGGDAFRRGIYTFFQRTSPYPMLVTFDAPDSTAACAVRSQSNTPLQALTLWNDPVFFECAQELGIRIAEGSHSSGSVHEQVEEAFLRCLARFPQPDERAEVERLFAMQLEICRQQPELAGEILKDRKLPAGVDAAEAASWILVGRTLLNLDEFITRD